MLGLLSGLALLQAAPALAAEGQDKARIITGAIPPIPGPRRTVAVGAIDVIGPVANASATNVGGAIAGMLQTALSESGEVILVERDAVAPLITEMDMAKSGVTTGTAAPRPGAMLPAQYLIVGSVTDYTAAAPGSGSGGGLSFGGSTAVTLGGSSGNVGIDLRIVDTHTGVVIKAFKVHHKLTSMNLGLSSNYRGLPVATNSFFNSPLGDATRKALNDAVVQIALSLAAIPWRGQVVKADGATIYVNAGSEAGVNVGDRMSLQHVGETLTDPATGAVLKQNMVELGVVTITEVEPKIATGTYRAILPGDPARGDYVVLQP
jgi:curli biogenesis system outer membrane secretion channel CsgG